MENQLMECGHAANGTSGGKPVCAICFPSINSQRPATVVRTMKALDGRMMKCSYTKGRDGKPCLNNLHPIQSSTTAPFFAYQPGKEFDSYYCGCWGWD